MIRLPKFNIRLRILIVTLIPAGSLALVLGIYFINTQISDLHRSQRILGATFANQLASTSEYAVYTRDRATLQRLAEVYTQNPSVDTVIIHDNAGSVLIEARSVGSANAQAAIDAKNEAINEFTFNADIMPGSPQLGDFESLLTDREVDTDNVEAASAPIGSVTVRLSSATIEQRRDEVVLQGVLIILTGLALILIAALWVSYSVTKPLQAVIRAVRRFREGNLDARISVTSSGELGTLQENINEMANAVKHSQDVLQEQIEQATSDLRQTLEAVEVKNVELDLARKRAITASNVKSEFLANISHEIRTPMNAIVGFTQLLDKTSLDSDQQDYLRIIRNSADSLLKLLDDVLNLSRIESGKLTIDAAPFNPRVLAESTLALVAAEAYRKQLYLVCVADSNLPPWLKGDSGKTQQVMLNLLHNAVKFTRDGTVTLKIEYKDKPDGEQNLLIIVRDTGIGIIVEQQQRLFEPFSQLDNTTTKEFGGVGLGLAICHKLVTAMQGKISVDSRLGQGTTFTVAIPSRTVMGIKAPWPELSRLTDARIALYERHTATADALQQRLRTWGADTWLAHDLAHFTAELARNAAAGTPYDMAIMGLDYKEVRYHDNLHMLWRKLGAPPPLLVLVNSVDKSTQQKISRTLQGRCLPKHVDSQALYEALIQITKAPAPLPAAEDAAPTVALRGCHVLVVEDNRINARLISEMLKHLEVTATIAGDGEAMMRALEQRLPDIVFMDIHLPGADGYELTRRLQQMPEYRQIPVYGLTAATAADTKQPAREAGMAGVLTKPVDEATLRATLETARSAGMPAVLGKPLDSPAFAPKTARASSSAADSTAREAEHADDASALAALPTDIRQMLAEDLPRQLEAVETALEARDLAALKRAVHQLHGSAAFCKLPQLIAVARNMEAAVDKQDWDAIIKRFPALREKVKTL